MYLPIFQVCVYPRCWLVIAIFWFVYFFFSFTTYILRGLHACIILHVYITNIVTHCRHTTNIHWTKQIVCMRFKRKTIFARRLLPHIIISMCIINTIYTITDTINIFINFLQTKFSLYIFHIASAWHAKTPRTHAYNSALRSLMRSSQHTISLSAAVNEVHIHELNTNQTKHTNGSKVALAL